MRKRSSLLRLDTLGGGGVAPLSPQSQARHQRLAQQMPPTAEAFKDTFLSSGGVLHLVNVYQRLLVALENGTCVTYAHLQSCRER